MFSSSSPPELTVGHLVRLLQGPLILALQRGELGSELVDDLVLVLGRLPQLAKALVDLGRKGNVAGARLGFGIVKATLALRHRVVLLLQLLDVGFQRLDGGIGGSQLVLELRDGAGVVAQALHLAERRSEAEVGVGVVLGDGTVRQHHGSVVGGCAKLRGWKDDTRTVELVQRDLVEVGVVDALAALLVAHRVGHDNHTVAGVLKLDPGHQGGDARFGAVGGSLTTGPTTGGRRLGSCRWSAGCSRLGSRRKEVNNVTLLENKVGGDACRGDGGEGQRRGGEGSECGCFRQTPSIICGLLAKEEGVVALSRVEAGQMRGRWLGREGLEQLCVSMEGRGGVDGSEVG